MRHLSWKYETQQAGRTDRTLVLRLVRLLVRLTYRGGAARGEGAYMKYPVWFGFFSGNERSLVIVDAEGEITYPYWELLD